MYEDHVYQKHTSMGPWLPAVFYSANLGIWMITAAVAGAWDLLFLAILPMPALVVYVMRTQRNVR